MSAWVGRQGPSRHRQAVAGQGFGVVEAGLIHPLAAEGDEAPGHLRTLRAEEPPAEVEARREQRVGPRQLAQPSVEPAQGVIELGLDRRLPIQRARFLETPVQQVNHPEAVRRSDLVLAALEELEHEALDPLGPGRFRQRGVPGAGQPHGVESRQAEHGKQRQRRGGDRLAMATDELAQAVAQAIGPGAERRPVEVAVDVLNQGVDRPIAPIAIGVHRREAEDVEVGPGGAALGTGVRHGALGRSGADRGGRALRLAPQHDRLGLPGRAGGQVEGQPPGKELVEDDAQRVHVGVGSDPLAPELLRRGVGRGHEPEAGAGLVAVELEVAEVLGDPEVQELHRPVFLDQDVGRLEVPVHDRQAVGVQHRFGHRAEEEQAAPERGPAPPAVFGERQTLHVLHDEPRRAVRQGVGIVEPRDGGMVEVSQGPLLGGEAFAPGGGERGVAKDLDRGQAPQVVALGQVHDPHPALAQHRPDPIRAEPLIAEAGGDGLSLEDLVGDVGEVGVEQRAAPRVLPEHAEDLGEQGGIVVGRPLEEGTPLRFRKSGRLVKEPLRALPASPIQGHDAWFSS